MDAPTDLDTYPTDEQGHADITAVEPLTLYKVDGRGRLNLAGVVADGTEFYTATQGDGGLIFLAPVKVATTAVKRGTVEDVPIPGI